MVPDICDHTKFNGWNDWNPSFKPELIKTGQVNQETNIKSP